MRLGATHQVISLRYGRPALSEFNARLESADAAIKPNETHVFKIDPKYATAWLRHYNNGGFPQMKKLWLRFQTINFGDGTGFHGTNGMPWPEPRSQDLEHQTSLLT